MQQSSLTAPSLLVACLLTPTSLCQIAENVKLLAADGLPGDSFSAAGQDVSRDWAVVGAISVSDLGSGTGPAYVFDTNSGQQLRELSSLDRALGDRFGVSVAISDDFGTAQATFNLADVPNQPGLLYSGGAAFDSLFGCGRRCVGGSVVRGSIMIPNGNQLFGVPFDMNSVTLTHIQYWYRDPANTATCGGSFNQSNALTL
ncbi:MAG: hypothetical protein ACI841_004372 [Planctomycetota bacterium]|jgi:hypothetical protein